MAQTIPEDSKIDLSSKAAVSRADRKLDDAIEDSFPASDPVALSMPHNRVESRLPKLTEVPIGTLFLVGGGLLALIAIIALRR